jgi:haloalkane dehalogenase
MSYVDAGPEGAPVALLVHGEPTWSFLYRRVIHRVVAAGFRVVAPDHIGFGLSDKLRDREQYSYARFVSWFTDFIETLDLHHITLVCQDWGGPISLSTLAAMPERFEAVVAANTLLPNCELPPAGIEDWPGKAISDWANMARELDDMDIGATVASVSTQPLDPAVRWAYDAPFPSPAYKAAALEFPCLIPLKPGAPGIAKNRQTWAFLERFQKPFVTAFSDRDPSTRAWEQVFQQRIPGARGQPHTTIENAGHFLQEDNGTALGAFVADFMTRQY